jgi:hypothetical protein
MPGVFERWIVNILSKLPPNVVIVAGNVPYHSVKAEKTPTSAWRKPEVSDFLQEKCLAVVEGALKMELLAASRVSFEPACTVSNRYISCTNMPPSFATAAVPLSAQSTQSKWYGRRSKVMLLPTKLLNHWR